MDGSNQSSGRAAFWVTIPVVVVVVVGVAFALNRNQASAPADPMGDHSNLPPVSTSTPAGNDVQPATTTVNQPAPGTGMAQAITVKGGEFYYQPNEIRVKKGTKVTVTFINENGLHDWVLEGYDNVRTAKLQGGKSETLTFTADKAGSFTYYCSVGQHRQMGMKGTLIVE